MRIREIAKHRLNRLSVNFHITADSRHSLNAAFCTNMILAGPQVSGKIENVTPKTGMFQNTTDTRLQHNAVVWLCLSCARICRGIAHNNLPPAMEVPGLIVPS